MTRNTEKRVEVATPILDDKIRRQINHYLKIMLNDNVKARVLLSDGSYVKRNSKEPLVDSQAAFMYEAVHVKREEAEEEKLPVGEWLKGLMRLIKRQP